MKFEISELGNRIIIKTRKQGQITKITPLTHKKALKTILNLQKTTHEITTKGKISDHRITTII